jgi:hypothetical protein
MALALKDRVKETTIVVGTGTATLLGSSIGFQPFSVVGNGNTTYYCISDQFGSNWEVGIGTYSTSGNTLARTTVLASSNGGALVVFTAGVKDVFVTYPAEKGVWLDASGNAIGLGTPAAFVGTNITGTASGLTSGNVTTNANLTGAVTSSGNATSLGSFTSAQLALAISDETGTGKAVFATNPTLTSPTYAGTLTGSTDILNIGSGQVYKDASGKVGINVVPAAGTNAKLQITGLATNATTLATAYSDASLVVVPKSTSGYSLAIASGTSDFPQLQVSANGAASGDLLIQPYGGNVGIGTTAPNNKLTVGTSNTTVGANCVASFSGANVAASNTSGMVVITPTDSIAANIGGSIGFAANGTLAGYPTGSIAGRRENATAGDYSSYMQFTTCSSGGSVQEKMRISSSGIVTMAAYGAGAATFSASGVISSVSDETWKIKDGIPVNPDEMIQKLKPGYWFYNAEKSPIFGTDRQLGFYAQNVNEAIGIEAAPVPEEGKPWGYYDRSVLAVTVMSLQKALTTIESLTERLTALENK